MDKSQKIDRPKAEITLVDTMPDKKSRKKLVIFVVLGVVSVIYICLMAIDYIVQRNNLHFTVDTAFKDAKKICDGETLIQVHGDPHVFDGGVTFYGSTVTSPAYSKNFTGFYCDPKTATQSLGALNIDGKYYSEEGYKEEERRYNLTSSGQKYYTPTVGLPGYRSNDKLLTKNGYAIYYFASEADKLTGNFDASYSCEFSENSYFGNQVTIGETDQGATIYKRNPGLNQALSFFVKLDGTYCSLTTTGVTTETEAVLLLKSIKSADMDEIYTFFEKN